MTLWLPLLFLAEAALGLPSHLVKESHVHQWVEIDQSDTHRLWIDKNWRGKAKLKEGTMPTVLLRGRYGDGDGITGVLDSEVAVHCDWLRSTQVKFSWPWSAGGFSVPDDGLDFIATLNGGSRRERAILQIACGKPEVKAPE